MSLDRVRLLQIAGEHRVVVYHQGALGDFLLCLSALEGLARALPSVRYSFRTRGEHALLVSNKTYFGGFRPGDAVELTPFFLDRGWETAPLPPDFSRAHAVLIFGQSRSISFAENLSRRLICPVHWIQSFPPDGVSRNASRFVMDQLMPPDWRAEPVTLRLQPTAEATAWVKSVLADRSIAGGQPFVVAHVGSGGRKKIWPLSGWRMLWSRWSQDRPERLVIVLGPADGPVQEFVDEMVREVELGVIAGLSLPQLAALLAHASAYVGNDSGVTHLAAAMGTPSLALFGPTSPEVWAPAGANVRVVRSQWLEADVLDYRSNKVDPSDVERVRSELYGMLA